MSRTIAMDREEAREDSTLTAELPPIQDWQVHFTEPGAQPPPVPWDPRRGRVESSGLIFLQGVAARLKEEQDGWRGAAGEARSEPFQALPTVAALVPVVSRGHSGVLWVAGIAAALVLAVGAAVGLRVWQDGRGTAEAGAVMAQLADHGAPQAATAAVPGIPEDPRPALTEAVVSAPVRSVASAPVAAPSAPKAVSEAAPAALPARRSAEGVAPRRAPSAMEEYSARRREERLAERAAEAKRRAELERLPSAQDALRALGAPKAAPAPERRPAAVSASAAPAVVAAAPAGDTYQMLRAATAVAGGAPRVAPLAALPQKLSAKVLYGRAQAVQARARACLRTFGFSHEVLRLRLEIAGSTGKVARASVAGRFGAMPVGACVVRAATGLTFPRFTDARQTVIVPVTGK